MICASGAIVRRAGPVVTLAISLGLFAASAASAHDFWIEPATFRPDVNSQLAVALRVGQDFRGDPVPRNAKLITTFALVSPSGEKSIGGFDGVDPAGIVRVTEPGLLWIAYRSGRTAVTLDAEKFEKYLGEEGLERIVLLRQKRGESGKPGREVFSRSAKSLVVAGDGTVGFDRVLGLTLELVLVEDPRKLRPGATLPVMLLYEGKPLEGALVTAMERGDPQRKIKVRTDRKGRALLPLPRLLQGVWLVKAVQMVPASADADADWESIWASLTFEIP
jgi:uncharacterized GH25 family protein